MSYLEQCKNENEGYWYTRNEDLFGHSSSKYHIEKMVKSFERSMKRTTQLKQIQEFIINNLAQKVVSIDDQSLFDWGKYISNKNLAEEIKMHRYKLFENTIINFDMWINRNDGKIIILTLLDKALFNDITDISKMMGAKIVYSDWTSPEFEYLYPWEFKDTET